MSNYNKFWVLQNVDPVLEKLKAINKRKNAKIITTCDFSTLYTTIPHNDLIEKLSRLVSFVFEGGDSKYISVSDKFHASWSKRNYKNPCFSERGVKIAVKHLIENCYFTVGKPVLRQAIGIPMDIDPAPFWANLFCYSYEEDYISDMIKSDKVRAHHFQACMRFIDDLLRLNDGGKFSRSSGEIYLSYLELKEDHSGIHVTISILVFRINGLCISYLITVIP